MPLNLLSYDFFGLLIIVPFEHITLPGSSLWSKPGSQQWMLTYQAQCTMVLVPYFLIYSPMTNVDQVHVLLLKHSLTLQYWRMSLMPLATVWHINATHLAARVLGCGPQGCSTSWMLRFEHVTRPVVHMFIFLTQYIIQIFFLLVIHFCTFVSSIFHFHFL